jgi:hypothetical protein
MLGSEGGTIFVDEAYQLTTDGRGKQVLDFILAEMENNVGKIVWIVAGYNREMEQFFEHNPGLQSRVPYTLQFKDYEDDELVEYARGSGREAVWRENDGRRWHLVGSTPGLPLDVWEEGGDAMGSAMPVRSATCLIR